MVCCTNRFLLTPWTDWLTDSLTHWLTDWPASSISSLLFTHWPAYWLTDWLIDPVDWMIFGWSFAAYLSSVRHRRNAASQTPYCLNGTILPSQSSSAHKGRPEVRINGLTRYLFVGENVKFKCTVYISKLPANVSWLLNGSALVAEKNRHEYQDCNTVLLIKGVLRKDAGTYTCVVQNEVGQATASASFSPPSK